VARVVEIRGFFRDDLVEDAEVSATYGRLTSENGCAPPVDEK